MEIVFRPLPGQPGKFTHPRHKAGFATDFNKVLHLLSRELRHLKAEGVIIQTAYRERDISVTLGRPLANAPPPEHPGIIIVADTKYGAQHWPCDKWNRWTDNLRAIALHLERLRHVAADGIGEGGAVYRGHKMLPGPITAAADAPAMTIEAAARLVSDKTGLFTATTIIKDKASWTTAYRAAADRLHPDRPTGNPAVWKQLQEAKTLLDGLHQGRRK